MSVSFIRCFFLLLLPGLTPAGAYAGNLPNGEKKEPETGTVATAVIQGVVFDLEDGGPVNLASVYIQELSRGTVSYDEGNFYFRNVPDGTLTLRVQHVGYHTTVKQVAVRRDDTLRVSVGVRPAIFRSSGIEIVAQYAPEDEITTYVERVLSGSRLRQQLGRTIAETLEDEPGMSQRSMGPAPARPVLRGLGGERLLILEDGGRTGDLSTTASDHALAIEPMTAEHIELVRGPSALIHGSNTMGGVINVIRGQIPYDRPDKIHWAGSLQGETVNTGLAGGLRAFGPVGEFLPFMEKMAFRFDLTGRGASDIRTPSGKLVNTGISTLNASAGLSYIDRWGLLGFSGNILDMKYGVPGGEGLAEAHPNGVDLEMVRRYMEMRYRQNFSDRWVRRLDLTWNYSYYYHAEYEKPEDRSLPRPLGAEFGVLTQHGRVHLHHRNLGFFEKGLLGIWGEHRNYASGGLTYTPKTIERSAAIFSFQERDLDLFNFQVALRYDVRQLQPEEKLSIFLPAPISSRTFSGFSGSFMGTWRIRDDLSVGTTVMRTHRSPIIEELYAEGPHLANFAYEIGNPALSRESGWGHELFIRLSRNRLRMNAAVFRNQMNNYIYPRDTGQPAIRRDDLNTFMFSENKVLMTGAELSCEFLLHRRVTAGLTANYVRGDFIDDNESFPTVRMGGTKNAVPMMPPLNGRFFAEFSRLAFKTGTAARLAARQNRVDIHEETTAAYAVFDVYSQYHFSWKEQLHTFSLTLENLANTEYRNHLSRIKAIMPEPGRNVKFLYRVYF